MTFQYTDAEVSRRKFEREIDEYRTLQAEYRRRGWLLVEAEFPRAVVVLAAPKIKPVPVVMGVSFDYTNYDAAPPSVRMIDPFTGEPYRAKDLPTQLNRALPPQEVAVPGIPEGDTPGAPVIQKMLVQGQQAYMQAHQPDDIPFLCVAGVREYHEHPAHTGDLWDLHRASGAGRLVRLLEIIWRYGVEPIAGFGVQLVPQIGLKFGAPPV